MTNRHSTSLSCLLAILLTASALCAQVVVYHNRSGTYHQQQYNTLVPMGYRMISLSIYGAVSGPRYAAVWVQRPGPAIAGFHGMTGSQYQTFLNTWWALGYRPSIVTATGTPTAPLFAGMLEQTNAPGWASHGLTPSDFWNERRAARDQGLDVIAADVYGSAVDPRIIASFGPVEHGHNQVLSSSGSSFQSHLNALTVGHARPSFIGVNDDDYHLSFWRSDEVGTWIAHGNMTASAYQNYFNTYWAMGLYPISLQGSGSGTSTVFTAVWAPSDQPLTPTFTKTGLQVGPLAPFDAWVENWMTDTDTRAAALAIVRDHRLLFARGYTRAGPGYPLTQPTSLFEVASCSKPITSIAMHQHFEDPTSSMAAGDLMLSHLPPTAPLDGRLNQITLDQLLTHRGGWDRDVTPDPMVGQDAVIATALSQSLPITKTMIQSYVFGTQLLDVAPGLEYHYSNFGFSLLGQVLEFENPGLTYEQIIRRDILQPLGLVRPQLAGSLLSSLLPGEVTYHPYRPMLSRSVMSNAQPWVAGQYGALNKENMDSHGGWVMAAPDYAKILAAFDLGASNPLLGPQATADMWTVPAGYATLMSGWFGYNVPDGLGGTAKLYTHGGLLYGAVSLIARRSDGLSFVFLTNGDKVDLAGSVQGVELNNLANTITAWPQQDLFPNVSIPPFVHQQGTVTGYGLPCYGSLGYPSWNATGSLDVGDDIDFVLGGVVPNSIALTVIGLQQLNVPLSGLGANNCYLLTQPIVWLAAPTGASGAATFSWPSPASAAAIGVSIHAQGAVLDPTANPFGLITTAGLTVTLGGWQ